MDKYDADLTVKKRLFLSKRTFLYFYCPYKFGEILRMMNIQHTLRLYEVVNKHFMNDEDSRTFVASIEEIMENRLHIKINELATRSDLKEQIANLRVEIANGFKEQLKWTIVLMISFAAVIVTVIKFL